MDVRAVAQRGTPVGARRRRVFGVLALALGAALLAGCARAGTAGSQADTGVPAPQVATGGNALLEVRASGSTGGAGEKTLPADVVDKVRSSAGAAQVEAYLFGKAPDGTVVVGIEPLEATFRTPTGQPLKAEILAGRVWAKGDEQKPVAYVGKTYGDTHQTPFGSIVSKMISPSHSPFVDLGGDNVVNVRAVVETGSPEGNAQVYVPLACAQKMFGQPGRVSKLYVTVESPEQREAVAQAIRTGLGDAAEVRPAG